MTSTLRVILASNASEKETSLNCSILCCRPHVHAANAVSVEPISNHNVQQSSSSSPHTERYDNNTPQSENGPDVVQKSPPSREISLNLTPIAHLTREKSLPVTSIYFPSETVRHKTFSAASSSYLNLAFPKAMYPPPIQILMDTCARGSSSAAGPHPSGPDQHLPASAQQREIAKYQERYRRNAVALALSNCYGSSGIVSPQRYSSVHHGTTRTNTSKPEAVRSLGKVPTTGGCGGGGGNLSVGLAKASSYSVRADGGATRRQSRMQGVLVTGMLNK